jgi:hypothetical protein
MPADALDLRIANGPPAMNVGAQIADLPNALWAGLDQAYKTRQRDAFKDGLPKTADGQLDLNAIAETIARTGGAEKALPAITAASGAEADANLSAMRRGGNGPSAFFPNAPTTAGTTPIASPPSSGAPPSTATTPTSLVSGGGGLFSGLFGRNEQREPGNPEAPPSTASALTPARPLPQAPSSQSGYLGYSGGDNGQNTIASVVAAQGIPDEAAGPVILEISRRTGLDPNRPIDVSDRAIRSHIVGVIQQAKRGGQQQIARAAGLPSSQPGSDVANGQPAPTAGAGSGGSPEGNSIAGIVGSAQLPPDVAPQIVNALARSIQAHPEAPLASEQATRVAQIVDSYRQRNGIASPQSGAIATDPTAGGLVPQAWIDRGGTMATYRDALAAGVAQRGASEGARAGAIEQIKAINKYIIETNTPTPDLKMYNAAVAHGYRGTPQQFQGDLAEIKKRGEVNAENSALTPGQKEYRDQRQPSETQADYEARKAGAKQGAEGIAGAGVDTFKAAEKNYQAAQATKYRLDLIDHSIEQLGPAGWMGSAAGTRASAARAWNTFAESSLAPDVARRNRIDPQKIATVEDFNKQTINLGFELARTLGSREAQNIVTQAVSSVPNVNQSPLGAKLVSASLRQAALRQEDFYEYLAQHPAKAGADVEFNRANPPEKYSLRATSSIGVPVSIKTQQQFEWLPSGATFIKDGKTWRKP